jgi:hypothetical protein
MESDPMLELWERVSSLGGPKRVLRVLDSPVWREFDAEGNLGFLSTASEVEEDWENKNLFHRIDKSMETKAPSPEQPCEELTLAIAKLKAPLLTSPVIESVTEFKSAYEAYLKQASCIGFAPEQVVPHLKSWLDCIDDGAKDLISILAKVDKEELTSEMVKEWIIDHTTSIDMNLFRRQMRDQEMNCTACLTCLDAMNDHIENCYNVLKVAGGNGFKDFRSLFHLEQYEGKELKRRRCLTRLLVNAILEGVRPIRLRDAIRFQLVLREERLENHLSSCIILFRNTAATFDRLNLWGRTKASESAQPARKRKRRW